MVKKKAVPVQADPAPPPSEILRNQYFEVPRNPSTFYTDRETIYTRLKEACSPPDSGEQVPQQRRHVLHGLGGSGKTQLCLKFAQDHRDKFWGVFWIDMSTDASAEQSFSSIGRVCGIGDDTKMARRWLSHCDQPWLLIMDNADNPQQRVSQYFPVCNRGTIIITTRNPRLASHATVGWQAVDRLEVEEAISLLLRTMHENITSRSLRKTAHPVVETLGCLALAITQAGAAIYHGLCKMVEFPPVFSDRRRELMSRHAGQISEDYEKTVYTTWEISLSMIKAMAEPMSSDALELLQVFGFMHYDGIPEEIFCRAWENLQKIPKTRPKNWFKRKFGKSSPPNWIVSHQLQVVRQQDGASWDQYRINEALLTLSTFSLISRNKNGFISLHPLVHGWIRTRLRSEQQALQWRLALSTLTSAIRWQYTIDDYRIRRLLAPILNACLSIQEDEIDHLLTESPDCLDMIAKISLTYAENGQRSQALKLMTKLVEMFKRTMGEEHPDTVRSMRGLALLYSDMERRAEALELMTKVVEVYKSTIGEEHPDTLRSMHDLALRYNDVGRRAEALKLITKVVEIYKSTIGEEHPDTVGSMHSLAVLYSEVGRRTEALERMTKVVEVCKSTMGEEHPDTVESMRSLAGLYSEVGRRAEALERMTKVVEVYKSTMGEEHPDTVEPMHHLAFLYRLLNRREEALTLMERVVAMSKRIHGEVDFVTLESLRELAVLYSQLNESAKALKLIDCVFAAFRKEFGEDHPYTLKSMNDLANICNECGQKTRALDIATEVEAKRNKALGREHPDTLTTMHNLAQIKFDMGQCDEATRLMREVVEDRGRILGVGHPDTIESQVCVEKFTMADERLS